MNMENHQRMRIFNDIDNRESFKNWQEKDKLTLRKNHIFDKLLSKRKLSTLKEEFTKSKYVININEISTNEEIKNNAELYIKTKFDIKNWFKYLFSSNINQIKEALYIIDLFVKLQIQELKLEKRILSRNDTDLINGLCNYLNHPDKQIAFYACCIISNLTFFPQHIESRIYTEKNLNKIMLFFNNNDFSFGYEIINLVLNCCTNSPQIDFFIKNKIFERLSFLMNTNLEKLEPKYYIYIIRLLRNLIFLFEDNDYKEKYNIEQIKNWFMPFLSFVKNTTKNYYVNNPWVQYEECEYFIKLINFYVNLNSRDENSLLCILKDDFCKVLLELYYKINDNEHKNSLMKVYIDFLSNFDSINQIFIDEGILGLLLNEINRIEYKNFELLGNILLACINIACGSIGQIEQLFGQGLIWKSIDIADYYSKQKLTIDIRKIMFNSILIFVECINGASNFVIVELMLYQDYKIIYLLSYAIKNIVDNYNKSSFLYEICSAFCNLIKSAESDLDEEAVKKFKNILIKSGMEEISCNYILSLDDNIPEEKKMKFDFNELISYMKE